MADQISTAWTNLARTDKREAAGLPEWPEYNAAEWPTMLFDGNNTRVENDTRGEQREFMLAYAESRGLI